MAGERRYRITIEGGLAHLRAGDAVEVLRKPWFVGKVGGPSRRVANGATITEVTEITPPDPVPNQLIAGAREGERRAFGAPPALIGRNPTDPAKERNAATLGPPEQCEHGCFGSLAGFHCGCCAQLSRAYAALREIDAFDMFGVELNRLARTALREATAQPSQPEER